MEYLIFSDTHYATLGMRTVIERCRKSINGILFLGDNFEDAEIISERYPELEVYAVAGNCDVAARFLNTHQELMLDIDGVKVLMLHGHRHQVKYSLDVLEGYARAKGANVVLFGHTHVPCNIYRDGIYMFNPGSTSQPRGGSEQSFGVLTVRDGQVLLSHGKVFEN